MFENMLSFFKKFSKKEKKGESSDTAKERLHLVLMQDRANVSADFLELMRQEIIEVIKKYIEIDEKAIDVKLTNKANDDGTVGAPALYANIPIITIKNEARKVDSNKKDEAKKEETTKKQEEKKSTNKEKSKAEEKEEKPKEDTNKEETKKQVAKKEDASSKAKTKNDEQEESEVDKKEQESKEKKEPASKEKTVTEKKETKTTRKSTTGKKTIKEQPAEKKRNLKGAKPETKTKKVKVTNS